MREYKAPWNFDLLISSKDTIMVALKKGIDNVINVIHKFKKMLPIVNLEKNQPSGHLSKTV